MNAALLLSRLRGGGSTDGWLEDVEKLLEAWV